MCVCRVFHADLQARLQQWGADQCVGDVLVKLCSKLRVYTNYLNNYTTALITIDRVRQCMIPPTGSEAYSSLRELCLCVISVQGDEASVSGFPEESGQNSCNTHAEVT